MALRKRGQLFKFASERGGTQKKGGSLRKGDGGSNPGGNCGYSFSDYYLPNVEIKDFNVLIDGKCFFDLPVKNKEEAYKKIIDMSNNNEYTTGNLLGFAYFKENYKMQLI